MPSDPNLRVEFSSEVKLNKHDIPVKGPDGTIVGRVDQITYSAGDGTTLVLVLTDNVLIQDIRENLISSINITSEEVTITGKDDGPEIVHLVDSTTPNSKAICTGEPYFGRLGSGPMKLCADCYRLATVWHADHKPVQHRDGKEPWCNHCKLTEDGRVPVSPFRKNS